MLLSLRQADRDRGALRRRELRLSGVARGGDVPTDDDDPTVSFALFEGARVYGGFAGNETALEQRDWNLNPTILSGDVGILDDPDDNCLHVVLGADGARLDGLTITDGYAREQGEDLRGAGLHSPEVAMLVSHCRFAANRTGDAAPLNTSTIGNPGGDGAGIWSAGASLEVHTASLRTTEPEQVRKAA